MSKNHKNVIEINGKLYDAKRGVVLDHHTQPQGHSIDGVMVPKPQTIIKPTNLQPKVYSQPLKPIKNRPSPNNHKHRSPQRSHTLMRKAVKKPTLAEKTAEIESFKRKTLNPARLNRAEVATRSPYINKYNQVQHQVTRRVEPIKVVMPPEHKTAITESVGDNSNRTAHSHDASQVSKSEQLFNQAMQKADTKKHASAKKKKPRSRALRWSSGITAALLLAGFITYMNLPNINVKFASTRAGFAAAMPGYQPSGYRFNGPVSYKPGQVAINFRSNTDDRQYTIKQEVSSWNSQSLQENYLTAQNKTFTTAQEGGRTVYIYGGGNATWVNGGVWYQVESSSLSSDQLLSIAASM